MSDNLLNIAKQAVKNWWVSLLVGVLAIALGVWCAVEPEGTLEALVILFIVAFLFGGILEVVFAILNKDTLSGWGWTLAGGIIDILFGVLLILLPEVTFLALLLYIGFWIMFRSVWAIGMAIELHRVGVKGWGWLLTTAVLGLIFSFIFILSPSFAASFIVAFVAASFILYGIFRIYLAFVLKSYHDRIGKLKKKLTKIEEVIEEEIS